MRDVVQLCRDAEEIHGRDLFACSMIEWTFMQQVARTFGWQPHGTTFELPSDSNSQVAATRDYEPGAASDRKLVTADDALAWARTLEEARRSPHFQAMISAELTRRTTDDPTAQSIADALDEFIQYAYGGAFTFARDDEADARPTSRRERP